jgi:hypothetical protein
MAGFEIRKPQGDEKTIFAKGWAGFVCVRDGIVVGWISKHRNTRTDKYPYQVFRRAPVGTVQPAKLLASFYSDSDVADILKTYPVGADRDEAARDIKGGGLTAVMVFARRHLRSN